MPNLPAVIIARTTAEPLDIALTEPFGIAGGAQPEAKNVLVRLELASGIVGLGEAAPFPVVSGETQHQTLAAVARMALVLEGRAAGRWRDVARLLSELEPAAPAARSAIEIALLDALCRHARISLWHFFGGAEPELETDITIPTGDEEHARASAKRARSAGFRTLKIKIGGVAHDEDVGRLRAILGAAPDARLVLDANASLSADEAVAVVEALGGERERVALFEQPTAAADLDGLRAVRERARVPVAADESARSARDVARLALHRSVDVVNLKLMKTGVAEALDMAATAAAHGLGLMIGGMVESTLAMTASACLAAGRGGFSFVDLDTPLFMREIPLEGGFAQEGPRLRLDGIEHGHGLGIRQARPLS